MWQGDRQQLTAQLKQANRVVTQAGYPEDHLDTLYIHQDCQITGWAQTAVLSHRCNTLPGDSGSPLMLNTPAGWQLIAIQSSAPLAKDRYRADNRALAVTAIRSELLSLAGVTDGAGMPPADSRPVLQKNRGEIGLRCREHTSSCAGPVPREGLSLPPRTESDPSPAKSAFPR